LIPLVPLVIIYLTVQQLYSRSSREIKRLESLTRSPLFAHFSESLNGLSTIRAYQLEQQFIKQNQKTLDVNQRCWFAQWMLQRWLGIRLELIGAFIIFFAAIFVVVARGSIEPGTAGLALSYALQVTVFLAFFVTQ
jgi:ATP-binding cassette subfamily C (CFTR/MRP) protein 1